VPDFHHGYHVKLFILNCILLLACYNSVQLIHGTNISDTAADKSLRINLNQSLGTEPSVNVSVFCQVASSIIPGLFNASGFQPNIHVGIMFQKDNFSIASSTPFTGFHNDITDSFGAIRGEFNIDSRKGNYHEHTFKIFADDDRNDVADSASEIVSAPIVC
jgi:hypothetical protein